ncbi:peptidase M20 [Aerococcus urinaeequi]|uniref:M20 metallopeptidase family protein n=1 Tax=Aerococcus urinaeequi TaxID=51665 RepID=UPI000744ABC4|nr:amidohydrolase [Aerococcus urinaeequi]ALZ88368.1 peptidase M20 [Aerococcus urinaeequi]
MNQESNHHALNYQAYASKTFQHLHRYPEISFHEYETRKFIRQQLESFGYTDITSEVGGGGVIARLKGDKPGLTIAFRADMDALQIQEETDLPYKSEVDGVMHACGHDAHTTILLTAAKYLIHLKEEIAGTIVFLFQHAEEVKPGGARAIMASGALDDVDKIFGLHVSGDQTFDGTISYHEGFTTANSDTFAIEVQGKGGHAASPHHNVDVTLTAAYLIQQLQSIVSRHKNPMDPGVVTVGNFHAGNGVANVMADFATLNGTIRTYSSDLRALAKKNLFSLSEDISAAHGASVKIDFIDGYPALYNHPNETQTVVEIFKERFGQDMVNEKPAGMGGEDFAYYVQKIPGLFYFIPAGAHPSGENYPHHHPKFEIDEKCLMLGLETILTIVNHYVIESEVRPYVESRFNEY